jgi:hypothetical protein
MTVDEEIDAFLEYYGDDVPNPEHEPIRFAYYVRMYRLYFPKEV